MSTAKTACYDRLTKELAALLSGERDPIANAANTSALLQQHLEGVHWVDALGVPLGRTDTKISCSEKVIRQLRFRVAECHGRSVPANSG